MRESVSDGPKLGPRKRQPARLKPAKHAWNKTEFEAPRPAESDLTFSTEMTRAVDLAEQLDELIIEVETQLIFGERPRAIPREGVMGALVEAKRQLEITKVLLSGD